MLELYTGLLELLRTSGTKSLPLASLRPLTAAVSGTEEAGVGARVLTVYWMGEMPCTGGVSGAELR